MPEWLSVILLGIIEGLTEFIPVSSTGHLVIAQHWLKPQSELFNVVIQCGAVLAVMLVFTNRLKELALNFSKPETRSYAAKLFAAFLITVVGCLILKQLGMKLLGDAMVVAMTTLVGGILILLVERWLKYKTPHQEITWPIAITVGLSQIVAATFPGTSRSGATILVALAFGLSRPLATEFSFLLGIPTLLAAGGYEILSALRHGEAAGEDWGMVFLGAIVAAITAFLVVKWLLRFVQSHTFVGFGWYRILLGILILVLIFSEGM